MIRFEELETTPLHKLLGGNGTIAAKIYADDLNRIVKSTYPPGASSGYHCHADSSEIIFILSGNCKVIHNDREERLYAGDCHYCKKGSSHAVINDSGEELVMYAVVCKQ